MTAYTVTLALSPCPRCGGCHEDVNFERLPNHGVFGYYAECPTTGHPVLLAIVTDVDQPPNRG